MTSSSNRRTPRGGAVDYFLLCLIVLSSSLQVGEGLSFVSSAFVTKIISPTTTTHCLSTVTSRSVVHRTMSTSSVRRSSLFSTLPTMMASPAAANTITTTTTTTAGGNANSGHSKLRQLKDRMWMRETLEDITAAEFASSLSVERDEDDEDEYNNAGQMVTPLTTTKKKKKNGNKRAVDFDNVLRKIDSRIEDMCILVSLSLQGSEGGGITTLSGDGEFYDTRIRHVLRRRIVDELGGIRIEDATYVLRDNDTFITTGSGLGSAVYTTEQREALLLRLITTRQRLVNFIEGGKDDMNDIGSEESDVVEDSIVLPSISQTTTTDNSVDVGGGKKDRRAITTFDPSLYVREDGTVDWDGALQDREALKKFGGAVWSRINGQDPEADDDSRSGSSSPSSSHSVSTTKAVTAKIEETDAIREKRELLDALRTELKMMEVEHVRLLNSAISAGQAIANVNFATIDASLRQRIRESSDQLDAKKAQVTFQTLNYELERIYTYLEGELGNASAKGYIPLQDRLNVAEFGLLESQVDSFNRQIESGEILDADVLAVVADQLVDFKRRLGIDYYVTGLTFDMEAIQVWIKDIWVKTKNGFTFYVKGTRLFSDDVLFCTSLILRASQGYTLKPREVRTLRRTFKDTITFIPVVIILLIPLSPIGHVLVFGAIQRVFPDFFPSCFTERRQNLLELYESTEYSAVTINENWQQKLIRVSQAIRILVIRMFNELYTSFGGVTGDTLEEKKE